MITFTSRVTLNQKKKKSLHLKCPSWVKYRSEVYHQIIHYISIKLLFYYLQRPHFLSCAKWRGSGELSITGEGIFFFHTVHSVTRRHRWLVGETQVGTWTPDRAVLATDTSGSICRCLMCPPRQGCQYHWWLLWEHASFYPTTDATGGITDGPQLCPHHRCCRWLLRVPPPDSGGTNHPCQKVPLVQCNVLCILFSWEFFLWGERNWVNQHGCSWYVGFFLGYFLMLWGTVLLSEGFEKKRDGGIVEVLQVCLQSAPSSHNR